MAHGTKWRLVTRPCKDCGKACQPWEWVNQTCCRKGQERLALESFPEWVLLTKFESWLGWK